MALTLGLMMTSFAGLVGLSVDVADWYVTRRIMQSAADAAALGGAREIFAGGTSAQVTAAATTDANLNGTAMTGGAVLSVSVATTAQTVTVTLSRTADLLFSKLLLGAAPTISVTAQAGVVNRGAPVCLLTTSTSAPNALTISGNGSIQATGCGMVVDSTSASAMTLSGNAVINTSSLCGPGGHATSGNAGFHPTPTSCVAMTDPLASWPAPSDANDPCQYNNASYSSTVTLSPGVYCGGISFSGNANATLQPGIYVLRNGSLTGSGNTTLTGSGVSFFLTGTGTAVQLANDDLTLSGNTTVNITAPSSGPMAGIAIYQDHSAPTGDITNTLSGNGSVNFTGVLYFGNQNVVLSGNASEDGAAAFTAFIANTLSYSGNAALYLNANYQSTSVPLPPGMATPVVALIQ